MKAILTEFRQKKVMDTDEFRDMYPTTETPPNFSGLPKVYKKSMAMRPIVSNIGSIAYAKHIAAIISLQSAKCQDT